MPPVQLLTPARSGVYRTPAHVETVKQAAADEALWIEIGLATAHSKSDLLDLLSDAFGFPKHFGKNWDALADALQDLSWRNAEGYVVRLREAADAARALGLDWVTVIDVLSETALYWKARGRAFVAFVDGIAELPTWI